MKKVVVLVLFAAIIALAIWLLLQLKGFGGLGKKTDEGEGKNDTSVSEVVEQKETTTAEEATEEKSEVINISVSKNEYVYDNKVTSLEDLVKIISEKDKNIEIEITIDDTAAKNTVDELTDKLDELGYKNYKKIDK